MVQIFNCRSCAKEDALKRGCIRPAKTRIWKIDECYFCGGKNDLCRYCHGKGEIEVRRCPRAAASETPLLPYFVAYYNSNYLAWPDGRGRLYQPKKLIAAFDMMTFYFRKLESKRIEGCPKR